MNAVPSRGPKVAVLMATCNAQSFVVDQVQSILDQRGVDVVLIASDDMSTDHTLTLLQRMRGKEPGKLTLLPPAEGRFGNANRNFLRLVCESDVGNAEFVALSDHDDIWELDRLKHACDVLLEQGFDTYSSDVAAFWPDGRRRLIRKSWPQRPFDHLFESAGPGCTFVIHRRAFNELREWMIGQRELASTAKVHDWMIYAFARSRGWRWYIDRRATVLYRQHASNEIGANIGWPALRARWSDVYAGKYFEDVRTMARLVGDESWVTRAMNRGTFLDRLRLVGSVRQLRRRTADCWLLALFLLTIRSRYFLHPARDTRHRR
jgi:rhamnosyltransferase